MSPNAFEKGHAQGVPTNNSARNSSFWGANILLARAKCLERKGFSYQSILTTYDSVLLRERGISQEDFQMASEMAIFPALIPYLDDDCNLTGSSRKIEEAGNALMKSGRQRIREMQNRVDAQLEENKRLQQKVDAAREARIRFLSAPPCLGRTQAIATVEKEEAVQKYSSIRESGLLDIDGLVDGDIQKSIFSRFGCRPFLMPTAPLPPKLR
ncbi:hypothetical protein [Synechococcus sp. 1G10]|uniref:hypothetical protein n=1 Tax=Synechococcus sp. 1G10 TaxID=2025605 RepID=UPI00117C8C83|nr:hypothetical protein [Synechococcus sp. 1G10]